MDGKRNVFADVDGRWSGRGIEEGADFPGVEVGVLVEVPKPGGGKGNKGTATEDIDLDACRPLMETDVAVTLEEEEEYALALPFVAGCFRFPLVVVIGSGNGGRPLSTPVNLGDKIPPLVPSIPASATVWASTSKLKGVTILILEAVEEADVPENAAPPFRPGPRYKDEEERALPTLLVLALLLVALVAVAEGVLLVQEVGGADCP